MYCLSTAKTVDIVKISPKSHKNTRTKKEETPFGVSSFLLSDGREPISILCAAYTFPFLNDSVNEQKNRIE